jgi:hypothetical protein
MTYSTPFPAADSGAPAREDARLERLARRRAGAKMGWYAHATVYVLVNLGLAALALANGRHWYAYPLLGWGLGLAIHGAAVWLLAPGAGWRERLVERERARLTASH